MSSTAMIGVVLPMNVQEKRMEALYRFGERALGICAAEMVGRAEK
jgi:hypothetical protein